MATYIILSRVSPEAFRDPKDFRQAADAVSAKIKNDCPGVTWKDSYATSAYGHSTTETLPATPWKEFLASL